MITPATVSRNRNAATPIITNSSGEALNCAVLPEEGSDGSMTKPHETVSPGTVEDGSVDDTPEGAVAPGSVAMGWVVLGSVDLGSVALGVDFEVTGWVA